MIFFHSHGPVWGLGFGNSEKERKNEKEKEKERETCEEHEKDASMIDAGTGKHSPRGRTWEWRAPPSPITVSRVSSESS